LRLAVSYRLIDLGLDFLFAQDSSKSSIWLLGATWFVAGSCLLMGFLTPIVSAVAAIGSSTAVLSLLSSIPSEAWRSRMTSVDITAILIALVFLGPGAFSLDARLFGRREIIIPDTHRPPRT
jgi:uncharacterized membrane protein YphA (DoxX/SURF4 family)